MAVSTSAQDRKDVDNLNVRDRLWDSLNYSYGKRGEQIGAEYDRLASQTNNQLLSRGMQRSSYGAQVVANVGKQRADAIAQNQSDLIADYENRLYQVERDEKADEQWQKQYDEQLRQFNENMAFQRERANVSDAQWEKEYAEKLRQFNEQMAEQRRQFDLNYNENVRQFNAQMDASSGGGRGGSGGNGGNGGNDGNGGNEEGGSDPYDAFLNALFGGSNANPGLDRVTGSLAGNSALGSSVTYNRNSPIANATRTDRNKMLTGPNAIYR